MQRRKKGVNSEGLNLFLQQNPKKSDFSLSGLGKPISNLSTFKQLQASHGRGKGESLEKVPTTSSFNARE